MITIEEREIRMADVVLPADYETQAKSSKVDEIEDSIRTHGIFQRPAIEQSTNELVWGRKRYAACKRLGFSHLPVRVVKFEDRFEKAIVVLRENLDRADLTPQERSLQRARIAELEEERAREKEQAAADAWGTDELTYEPDPGADVTQSVISGTAVPNIAPRVGRPSKGRAEAAAKLKISKRQLSKDIKRAKAIAKGTKDDPPASDLGLPDHGLELDAQVKAEIKGAVADFAELGKCLRKAVKLARARRSVLSDDLIQSIEKDLKAVEANTPAMVCPHCACRPRMLATCGHCLAQGWISKAATQYVPPELLDLSKGKKVFLGGKLVKASAL